MNDIEDVLPLAPLQEGLYFHSVSQPHALDVYVMQSTYRFERPVAADLIERALNSLLTRHSALRAGFMHEGLNQCVQFIPSTYTVPFRLVALTENELSTDADAASITELAQLERREREKRFDLDRPPLLRAVLAQCPDGSSHLIITNHHIIMDGWSDALFVVELARHIAAGGFDASLPEPMQFRAFLEHVAATDPLHTAEAWAANLAGIERACLVSPEGSHSGVLPNVVERDLRPEVSDAISRVARRLQVSVSTVYSCVWALVLRELTGHDDAIFGVTVSGRAPELDGVDECIGLFLNTVPLRIRLSPAETLNDLLQRVQREQAALLDAHHVSLSALQREANLGTLFDTLYVMRNTPEDDNALDGVLSTAGITDIVGGDATHYPLTFITHPGETYRLILSYQASFASAELAEQLMNRCLAFAGMLAARSDLPLGMALESLTPWQQDIPTELRPLDSRSLLQQLASTAADVPDRIALRCDDSVWTFADFTDKIAGIAALLREAGVSPGDRVALALPRGNLVVAAMFACFAVRAAYVPLDLEHPDALRIDMAAQAQVAFVLQVGPRAAASAVSGAVSGAHVSRQYGAPAGSSAGSPTEASHGPIYLDLLTHRTGLQLTVPAEYSHEDLAYVMFTSGSTGKPKGVAIAHRGLVNMLSNHQRRIFEPATSSQATTSDRALVTSRPRKIVHTVPFTFDMSWEELLWLIEGHEVHIAADEMRKDPVTLNAYLAEHSIDVINVTPTVAQALIAEGLCSQGGPRPELILLGGEAVSTEVWRHVRNAPGSHGYNLYGPTEYTINTLGGGTQDSSTPTVGVPIDNTEVMILDSALMPVPAQVPGELYIRGVGLAWGYFGNGRLSADRFVACPFGEPGERMYRTGDVASWRRDGQLDFHGRTDDQVKIRGVRIELSHVNACISACERVSQSVTLARLAANGTPLLVSYVVGARDETGPHSEAEFVAEVLTFARANLAAVMVPQAIVAIPNVPLTSNGKLDLNALPLPHQVGTSRAPATELEKQLAQIFAEVLDLPSVSAEDDFFALGGHSLLTMKLVGRLAQACGRTVPLAALTENPTVALLAEFLAAPQATHSVAQVESTPTDALFEPIIELSRPVLDAIPLVCIHPAGGLGWSFAQLAGHLPGVPVYAVQSPFLSGGQSAADGHSVVDPHVAPETGTAIDSATGLASEFEALAVQIAGYVATVAQRTDSTRVHLLGWSFGAHIAQVAISILEGQGINVVSLSLLDAHAIPAATSAKSLTSTAFASDHERTITQAKIQAEACRFLLATSGRDVPATLLETLDPEHVVEYLLDSQSSWSALNYEQIKQVMYAYQRNVSVMPQARYQPTQVPVLLCSAGVNPDPGQFESWQPYCSQLQQITIPVSHHFMTTPAASSSIAPALFEHLQAASALVHQLQ